MAVVTSGKYSIDLSGQDDDTFSDLGEGTVIGHTSNAVQVLGESGDVIYTFGGTGFSNFNAAGIPTNGTITSFVETTHIGNTLGLSITGVSMPMSDFLKFFYASNATGALKEMLSGNDTITGSPQADKLYGYGGNDTIVGGKGHDELFGGAGNDHLRGADGSDDINGGDGNDTFVYKSASESTSTKFDIVTGADFDKADKFDFSFTVTGIGHKITTGALTDLTFDANIATAANADVLAAHHAILFTPDSGGHAHETFLIVDANGHAGYQAGQDFVIELDAAAHLGKLSLSDFT